MTLSSSGALVDLLPQKDGFPTVTEVVAGRTLSKRNNWWKAILLVATKYYGKENQQLRLYAWQWNEPAAKWKLRQKYNFSGKDTLPTIVAILEAYRGGAIGRESTPTTVLAARVYELEEELRRRQLEDARNMIPHKEEKIREFERLLARRDIGERELQKFLHLQYWMLGAKYRRIYREKWAGMKGRNDFLLEKEIGFCDILELKHPADPLFVGGKAQRMSAELKDAISQMASYLDYYYKNYLSHKEQTQMDVLHPKGMIVIGRRNEKEKEVLEAHRAIMRGNVEIMTYDDVLNEARQVIKVFKKRSRRIQPDGGKHAFKQVLS